MYLTYGLNKWSWLTPEAPALICNGRETSYGALRERVSRMAGWLGEQGMAAGDRVAILSLNSDRAVEVMLGAIWGGGIANNLNIRWSAAELSYAINDCGARILAVDGAFAGHLPALREACPELAVVLYLDDDGPPEGASSSDEAAAAAPVAEANDDPHRAAIINYTGGTTGRSKGVMMSHAAFSHAAAALQGDRFFLEGERACLTTPLFHVTGLSVVLMNMAYGNPVVVLPAFEPVAAMRLFEAERVSHTVLVPTMIQMLVEHPDFERYDLSRLRYIRYGGSPISEALLARVAERLPQARLCQVYGQTEIMPLTVLRDEDHTPEAMARGLTRSAGRATPYVEVFAADDAGNRLPPGEIGEIHARGLNAMLGYWNKPELTAETMPDGWSVRTGDVGYFDAEGYLYLVDRRKDMIVTGGENVYSTEVEQVLAGHPAVLSCAVVARPDERWGEAVHAFVVPREGESVTVEALQAHCREHIAGYKVPRGVDFLDALPVTGPGKVDKVALRERLRTGD
ncbi:AMP-binding protein [Ectothiorhodospiraceae bacterium WFHF3C12]|nr:AMP-binding protein [Ectothiorhodospiraceae bacterium WFHF3C12]